MSFGLSPIVESVLLMLSPLLCFIVLVKLLSTNQELLDEKRKQTKLMEKQFGPLTNNPETFSDEKSRQDFDDQVVANRRKGELGFFILIGGLILFVIVVGFIFSLMGN